MFQGLLNATLSVDTFYFISGLLTIYVTWRRITQTNKFQPIAYTLLRYIRLTPPYLAVIGFAMIFPMLSSGPLWHETVDPVANSCYKTWWINLLYINNFVDTENLVSNASNLICAFIQRQSSLCTVDTYVKTLVPTDSLEMIAFVHEMYEIS